MLPLTLGLVPGNCARVARLLRELKRCSAHGFYHILVSMLRFLLLFTCPAHGFYEAYVNYTCYLHGFYDRQLKINALRMGFMRLMLIILAICMGFMTGNLKPVQIAVRIKRRL